MKFHNGSKRVNKLDGGKAKAKKQYHKSLRKASASEIYKALNISKEEVKKVHKFICTDPRCSCDE